MPTAPADRFTLAPRIATTKPPALKSSPTTQQILPKNSFSASSRPSSLCTDLLHIALHSSGPFVLRSGYRSLLGCEIQEAIPVGVHLLSHRFLLGTVFVKVFDAPLEELGEGQSGEHQDQHHAQQAPDGYDYAAPPALAPAPTPTDHRYPPLRATRRTRTRPG